MTGIHQNQLSGPEIGGHPVGQDGAAAVDELGLVLGLALLPAVANVVGGALAHVVRVPARGLSLAPHSAAGIVLAVVGLELMPTALQAVPPWVSPSSPVASSSSDSTG